METPINGKTWILTFSAEQDFACEFEKGNEESRGWPFEEGTDDC